MISVEKELKEFIEQEVKILAVNLLSELSIKTPVDTGAAVYNWKISVGKTDNRARQVQGAGGESARGAVVSKETPKLQSYNLGDLLYIQNNLPYIGRLNDGYSDKAPSNFVESAIANANSRVRKFN